MDALDPMLNFIAWIAIGLGTVTLLYGVLRGVMSWKLHDTIAGAPSLIVAALVQYALAVMLLARRPIAELLAPLAQIDSDTLTAVSLAVIAVCLVLIVVILATSRRKAHW